MKETRTLCDVENCNKPAESIFFYNGENFIDAAGSKDYDVFSKDLCQDHIKLMLVLAIKQIGHPGTEVLMKTLKYKKGY